jgi:hypothetical protein
MQLKHNVFSRVRACALGRDVTEGFRSPRGSGVDVTTHIRANGLRICGLPDDESGFEHRAQCRW